MTTGILDALRKHDAPATGFVIGPLVLVPGQVDELLDEWMRAGVTLGNHSHSRTPLSRTTLREYESWARYSHDFPGRQAAGNGLAGARPASLRDRACGALARRSALNGSLEI